MFESDGLDEDTVKFSSNDEKSPLSSPAPSEVAEQEKMEICEDLDDISEGELLPSDKESEEEVEEEDEKEVGVEDEEEKIPLKEEKKSFVAEVKESAEMKEERIDESVEPDLSVKEEIGDVITESSSPKAEIDAAIKVENQVERTKEASEALLELASSFADFGRPSLVEPAVEEKHDKSSETISITEECMDEKAKLNDTVCEEFDSEATLSADEVREFKDLCSDEELSNRIDSYGGSIVGQLISEHSYCLPISVRTEVSSSVSNLEQNNTTVETVIDSVVRGPKQIALDHEYTRVRDASPTFVIPRSPPKVMPRRKTKLKRRRRTSRSNVYKETFTEDVEQTPAITQSESLFEKRSVIDELNILYEFLKNSIDYEDTVYLQKGYDMMLQEDIQGAWLNSTHWVDHPHILSFSLVIVVIIVNSVKFYFNIPIKYEHKNNIVL